MNAAIVLCPAAFLGKTPSSLLFRLTLASADPHSEQGFGEGHQNEWWPSQKSAIMVFVGEQRLFLFSCHDFCVATPHGLSGSVTTRQVLMLLLREMCEIKKI